VNRRGIRGAIVCVAMGALLAACGHPRSVTAYEPGVYKGEKDPLLEKLAAPEQKEQLKKRFEMGQTDR
jgi:hypothetical protein